MLLAISYFSLVGFSGGVLDFIDVAHKFAVGSVDVVLEEGLNDTAFLLLEATRVGGALVFH
jgi:hypothetical protein